jgi:DNA invertase Pin-like site-specific DNA recombinase
MQEGKSKLIEAVQNVRAEIYSAVRAQLADETKTYQQIADTAGCSLATVQRVAQMDGISRPVGPRPKSSTSEVPNGDN